MTSQTGKQMITLHLLTNISRAKGNHAMKLGQSIKYNVRNFFLQKSCRNEAGRQGQNKWSTL